MDKVFNHSVKTDVGLVRKANEDAAGFAPSEDICNNGDLFIVCDGMGGHVGGSIASNTAVQSIIDHFKSGLHENAIIAINDAIVFANEQIFARAQAEPELKGMGTTCTILLIRGSETFIGHVGDSRIYIQSKDKLHRITKDHSFVQTLVDQGLISDADAESHPRKNELIKALGIRGSVEPEVCIKAIEAVDGDCFMMCSDGLSGLVDDHDMQDVISSSDSIDNKADKLISMAKAAGGHDNITVALIDIQSSPFSASVFVDYSPKENVSITGDMNPLESTQEIGGLASSRASSADPIWKNPKFLVITGICLLFIVAWIVFNPFNGEDPESDKIVATDSDGELDEVISFNNDTSRYIVIIKSSEEGTSTAGGAESRIKDSLIDGLNYHEECLVYSGKAGTVKTKIEIDKLTLQPGDSIWLNCKCAKMMDDGVFEDKEKPDDKPIAEPANISDETKKDTIIDIPKIDDPENKDTLDSIDNGNDNL